jgi:hypothetical protein
MNKNSLVAATGAVTILAGLVAAAPAQASELEYVNDDVHKCKVAVSEVVVGSDPQTNETRIKFNMKVKCPTDRKIKYAAEIWEQDLPNTPGDVGGSDRLLRVSKDKHWVLAQNKSYWWVHDRTKSADSPDRWGEYYMVVKIQVKKNGETEWSPVSVKGPVSNVYI